MHLSSDYYDGKLYNYLRFDTSNDIFANLSSHGISRVKYLVLLTGFHTIDVPRVLLSFVVTVRLYGILFTYHQTLYVMTSL